MAGNDTFAPMQIGSIQTIEVPSAAAGADFSCIVPQTPDGGDLWRVLSIKFILTTSAVAGNRFPAIRVVDPLFGSVPVFASEIDSATPQLASTSFDYYFQPGQPVRDFIEGTNRYVWLPFSWATPGTTIKSDITGLLAGDQITFARIVAQVWRVPV